MRLSFAITLLAVRCTSIRLPLRNEKSTFGDGPIKQLRNLSLAEEAPPSQAPNAVDLPGLPFIGLSNERWNQLLMEGCSLLGMMSTRDSVAASFIRPEYTHRSAESEFTDPKALQDWGYSLDDTLDPFDFVPEFGNMIEDLRLKRISPVEGGGTAVNTDWTHDYTTTHDGIQYLPTGAEYRSMYDADQGVMIWWWKFGPAYMGKRQDPPVTTLPKLKNLHDVAFLDWTRICQVRHKPTSNLRYMISHGLSNIETRQVIQRLLGTMLGHDKDGQGSCERNKWNNRKHFVPADEGYKALLASPNGRGAALMLITHKSVFGQRRSIRSIDLWCDERDSVSKCNLQTERRKTCSELTTTRRSVIYCQRS